MKLTPILIQPSCFCFFLLIGRYLDLRARNRTKDLGQNLLALQKPTVMRLQKSRSPRRNANRPCATR